jgi:hypothetical protein
MNTRPIGDRFCARHSFFFGTSVAQKGFRRRDGAKQGASMSVGQTEGE